MRGKNIVSDANFTWTRVRKLKVHNSWQYDLGQFTGFIASLNSSVKWGE